MQRSLKTLSCLTIITRHSHIATLFAGHFYELQIYNNIAQTVGMFSNTRRQCEICEKEHKENCSFDKIQDTATMGNIAKTLKRDLIIVAHWKN